MDKPAAKADIEAKPGVGRAELMALMKDAAERAAAALPCYPRGPARQAFGEVQRRIMSLAVNMVSGGDIVDAGLGVSGSRVRRACLGIVRRAVDASGDGAAAALGAMYESLLALHPSVNRSGRLVLSEARVHARKTTGSYYTPAPVVEHLLDSALGPVLAAAGAKGALGVRVCDPACGSGNFLVAAARRIARMAGGEGRGALRRVVRTCIFGVDIDPLAAALCRVSLRLEAGGGAGALKTSVRCADALIADWPSLFPGVFGGGFDAVIGNPPYLSQLARETAVGPTAAAALRARFPGAVGAYTDPASLFLLVSTEITRPGGRVALVLPQSVLATRDAAGVRERVLGRGSIEALWMARERVFDAGVMVCAPTIRVGPGRGSSIRRCVGPAFRPVAAARPRPGDLRESWAGLGAVGVPEPSVRVAGTLADLATATADFRDQYYGLRGCVVEGAELTRLDSRWFPPLVTSGLIDPARCHWGRRPLRFDRRVWAAPRVDVGRLDDSLRRWARARMVPKVLLATQTRVLEAAVDRAGEWIPCVPLITLVPRLRSRLWHLAAVLLSPVATAWAVRNHGTAGLSATAIKLSAKQALCVPIPEPGASWDRAAALIRRATRVKPGKPRFPLLAAAAAEMGTAYRVRPAEATRLMRWWTDLAVPAAHEAAPEPGNRLAAPRGAW